MIEKEIETQKFIVKYFTEIMIKGDRAKKQMLNQLLMNLQKISKEISDEIVLKKFFDKIELVTPLKYAASLKEKLLQTSGIDQVLEAIQINEMDSLDKIKVEVNRYMANTIIDKTFVVRAKRVGTQDFKSIDIEQTVGGYMLAHNNTRGVDLRNAEVTIKLELEHNKLNIITEKYKGLGGFPLGAQGEILSLMSGGFDSTVASYLSIKRGLKTHFVFFNLGGIAHEIGVKQVSWYLWNKFASSHRVSFITIPFEDVVGQIFKDISPSYMGVMLKRLMIKAAQEVAKNMSIDAIITGESVAQVSSQTLRNLSLIDSASDMLILRPLAFMSKPEIIDIATKIGTKKFAEAMPEYCGVISQNPVTHGSFDRVEKEAKKFDYTVLDIAIKNAKIKNIDEVLDDVCEVGSLEVVSSVGENEIIIDIRQSEDSFNHQTNVLKIPFYNLKKSLKNLIIQKHIFYIVIKEF